MLSFTYGHTSLQMSYFFCLVLLQTGRSVLLLLSPSTDILISPRFVNGISHGFLETANPEWWFSSYRQHKVVIDQREPEGLRAWPGQLSQSPQPGEIRERGCAERWGQEQRLLLAVLEMPFHPCLPADYTMPLNPNLVSVVFALIWFSLWTGAGRIAYLSSRRNYLC